MKTERVGIAYRLLFAYPFVRPESEQNSSHLQIDCDRVVGNRDSMFRHSVIHDLLSAEDDRSPGDFHSTGASYVPRMVRSAICQLYARARVMGSYPEIVAKPQYFA